MSSEQIWADVDDYLVRTVSPSDDVLDAVLAAADAGGLPEINVAPNQGALLSVLVGINGARRVLEVGTLGGYSAIWMARALPAGGRVITCEVDPHHAEVAAQNFERAGVSDRVEIRIGPAADTLQRLVEEGMDPFDLVFIDADKQNNPTYLARALELTHPGSVIMIDNVVRAGRVADASSSDASDRGTREVLRMLGDNPRLRATALQTVGSKGHDGFALAVVTD